MRAIILTLLILSGLIVCASGVSVHTYGTNYIIWNTTDDTYIHVSGEVIDVSNISYYSQYDLTPDTEYMLCSNTGCTGIVTKPNTESILLYWGVYFVLIGLVIASYRYPVSGFPCLIFGIYVLSIYLPSISAGSSEYILTGVLITVGMAASWYGMHK